MDAGSRLSKLYLIVIIVPALCLWKACLCCVYSSLGALLCSLGRRACCLGSRSDNSVYSCRECSRIAR